MRRLPVFFLIDVSESMVGDPIQQVEEGLATIIKELKSNPYALETVWVSIIVFAGKARTIVPLQELINFYPPKFPIGSGTSLSSGLSHLMLELRKNIIRTTQEQKGDWKPIIFLFTDGVPTDETSGAASEWKQSWHGRANLIAVSFGEEGNVNVLRELTENVILFDNATSSSYREFFKWVTDSIRASSESIENNQGGFGLAPIDEPTISKIDLTKREAAKQNVDPNFVVLAAKCQNTKRPYLMKYKKDLQAANIPGLDLNTLSYRLVGAFQVDNNYFELSENSAAANKVGSDELLGSPTCPCCGNQIGFALCSCGRLHCIGMEEVSTCPWCGNQGTYVASDLGFDVNRAEG